MIYFVGDIHGEIDISKLNTRKFAEQKHLTKDDYVIICGDFGCIWNDSKTDKYWIRWLEQKNFTTLFVDGNHENFNLLYKFPLTKKFGGTVGVISNSVFHLRRGEVYNIDNIKVFAFGGAKSNDIEYRVKDLTWWEAEMPTRQEMDYGLDNLMKENYAIDIVVTHTCPSLIFDRLVKHNKKVTKLEQYLDVVRELLDNNGTNYHWYFGHFHTDACIEGRFHCLYQRILKGEQ